MADLSSRPKNAIFEIAEGTTVHYACQNGNELEERDFDGELSPPEPIGPAKWGTSGNYIIFEDKVCLDAGYVPIYTRHTKPKKRTVYCLDERNKPQDFEYDEDIGEWVPGELASVNVDNAPETQISAVRAKDGTVYVFVQRSSGEIQALSAGENGRWSFISELPVTRALPGGSLHSISVKEAIHLFYAHRDNSIHKLSLEDGAWNGQSNFLDYYTSTGIN